MKRSTLEMADVVRRYGDTYRDQAGASLSTAQRRVMLAIEQCRTAALGGHVEACDHCGHRRVWYNSCRNRHCPSCQALARAAWIEARQAELLDTAYFHVVFTVPNEIAVIAAQNKAVVYGILFRTAAETLRTIAADPTHLGAEIGFFAVLHTWGQTLVHHPHLHCVVPGGGLSIDGTRWVCCRPGFFLPVRVLSRLFRRLFLEEVQAAFDAGCLQFSASFHASFDRVAFADHLAPVRRAEWVVYAKRPFAGPEQVLDYVGRYTHRVAISNHRLIDMEDGRVRFRYKDYRAAHPDHPKTMTLAGPEFIRALSSARAATRIPSDPVLRVPRQSAPERQARSMPSFARLGDAVRTRPTRGHRLSRSVRGAHRRLVARVPALSARPDDCGRLHPWSSHVSGHHGYVMTHASRWPSTVLTNARVLRPGSRARLDTRRRRGDSIPPVSLPNCADAAHIEARREAISSPSPKHICAHRAAHQDSIPIEPSIRPSIWCVSGEASQ